MIFREYSSQQNRKNASKRKLDVLENYGCDATTHVTEQFNMHKKLFARPHDVQVLCIDTTTNEG